ncbi:MAG: PQQ-dependent sugar dehydrogenase, partial [Saprospiraceae bacterium]
FSQPDLVVNQITTVTTPVDMTGAGDGSNRLFIVDKSGKIRIFDQTTNMLLPGIFLDISSLVLNNGERGLLGLAFHPNYANNGYFYVNYVHTGGTGTTTVSRFRNPTPASNGPVSIGTEQVLLSVPQPYSNHNGGDLNFGPDGFLYVGMGDGGDAGDPGNRAQNPQELLGKMLRIDVNGTSPGKNYAIPADNPFVGVQTPVDYLDEIWAVGMRNPWRFSFDRQTGDLWIADVGQGLWEEVDFQAAASAGGENYGWRCYEGDHTYVPTGCGPMSNYVSPIFEYTHNPSTGGNSITGGFVYRGSLAPALQGWYICADYTSDNFWLIHPDGSYYLQTNVPVIDIVSFGEDDAGELYVSSYGGQIYRVTSSPLPITLSSFSGRYENGSSHLIWSTATEKNGAYFQVERKTEGGDFQNIGRVTAVGESTTPQHYFFDDPLARPGENIYRLRMVDRDGSFKFSSAITILVLETGHWQLSPNPATGQVTLSVYGETEPARLRLEIYNTQGRQVLAHEQIAPTLPYHQKLQIGQLPVGVYFCRLEIDGKTE